MKQIDFTATFKKLRAAFVLYNDKVKLKHPDQYRKLSLKSTHMETARELIRCYAAHLLKPGQLAMEPSKTVAVSNRGIGRNKLQHRATIHRHMNVLRQTGIIMGKTFHGSAKGIEIELNQDVLVYKKDPQQLKSQIQAEIAKTIAKNDGKDTKCDHKDSSNLQVTNNINKGCGYVEKEKTGKSVQGTPTVQTGTQKAVPMPLDAVKACGVPQKRTRGAGDDPEFSEIIDFYTQHAWHFARSVLYHKQELSNMQERLAMMYVRDYFSLIKHESFKRKFVDRAYDDFCKRVVLAKRYVDRSPERFIPLPSVWFNKYFPHGFCGTLSWLNKVKSNKTTLSVYMKRLSVLCTVYKQYLSDPNVHNYCVSVRKLEALGDTKLVEYFNHCVADRSRFDVVYLRNYYKFTNDDN